MAGAYAGDDGDIRFRGNGELPYLTGMHHSELQNHGFIAAIQLQNGFRDTHLII